MPVPPDDEVLALARTAIAERGFAVGADLRDRYARRNGPGLVDWRGAGATISWTAALKRLARRGLLGTCQLQTRRGKDAGTGFVLPAKNLVKGS